MKKKLKNAEMAAMLNQLRPVLVHRDKIGYFAARNFRVLSECLTEYDAFRNSLIEKYGEETKDDKGRPIIGVKVDSPHFCKKSWRLCTARKCAVLFTMRWRP